MSKNKFKDKVIKYTGGGEYNEYFILYDPKTSLVNETNGIVVQAKNATEAIEILSEVFENGNGERIKILDVKNINS